MSNLLKYGSKSRLRMQLQLALQQYHTATATGATRAEGTVEELVKTAAAVTTVISGYSTVVLQGYCCYFSIVRVGLRRLL